MLEAGDCTPIARALKQQSRITMHRAAPLSVNRMRIQS